MSEFIEVMVVRAFLVAVPFSVRDIRVLRIEELNDMMPLVQRIAGLTSGGE